MAQTQIQTLEDSSSEAEETRVSLRREGLEVIVIRTIHQVMKQTILPKISAIVKGEVELAIEKHLTRLNHHSGSGQSSESRTLQLEFRDKLSLPVLTNSPIKGEGPTPFRIALVDATTKQVVTSGLEASAKVEIVVVERDFNGENWTREEFNNKIVRGKEGKKSLLTGNVHLNLERGVAFVREISFTHNSHWMKACELRLGAKVVGNLNGTRVREAVTEPFLLKDYRKTYNEKHYPPSPNDEVWRLEKIGKDGPSHNHLVSENIKTVKDFLTRYWINPKSLQNILGAGKLWKSTVTHAQTCKIWRLYFPIGSGKESGVVFNAMEQVMGLISECCYVSCDVLSEDQKADANKLVVSALEHMGDVMTFDDETSLHSHLQILRDAYPSYSPMLELPNHYNCEPLNTHHGHDHTQPSSSSHNNQVVPFHLTDANPSNIPITDSLGIMSVDVDPSFGNESYLNEHILQTIASTSSHNNQVAPLHLPDAANPSNIPSTDSLGIMSVDVDPSFGNESYLDDYFLDYLINEGSVIFPGNSFSPSRCCTESAVDTDHSFQYQYQSSEAQHDLSIFIIDGPAANIAQRRWSMLFNVLRSKRKIAALKLVSSLASKRTRIHRSVENC
ncbi:hypothetical protein Vadar_007483 [Vaccinium darrowii]|uniref:Uncharacterized protein n=1 Tax=Vaccinium darrowii TaxID=229202 RepID=A0ACB7ZI47_9ERIC|nr:hypothetical protein Vadar_007483 [Vaccinium darrowii]